MASFVTLKRTLVTGRIFERLVEINGGDQNGIFEGPYSQKTLYKRGIVLQKITFEISFWSFCIFCIRYQFYCKIEAICKYNVLWTKNVDIPVC